MNKLLINDLMMLILMINKYKWCVVQSSKIKSLFSNSFNWNFCPLLRSLVISNSFCWYIPHSSTFFSVYLQIFSTSIFYLLYFFDLTCLVTSANTPTKCLSLLTPSSTLLRFIIISGYFSSISHKYLIWIRFYSWSYFNGKTYNHF